MPALEEERNCIYQIKKPFVVKTLELCFGYSIVNLDSLIQNGSSVYTLNPTDIHFMQVKSSHLLWEKNLTETKFFPNKNIK